MISIIRLKSQENRGRIWDSFLDSLDGFKGKIEGNGKLLYLTQRAKHQDISLFVHVSDPNALGEFIAKELSQINDITSIWVIHLMKPLFFPLPKDTREKTRFSITAKAYPAKLQEVYKSLVQLSGQREIQMAYIAYTMHLFEESLIFSMLANAEETLEKFLKQNVDQISGILQTNAFRIAKTKPLISYEEWKKYATQHAIVPSWDVDFMINNFQV